MTDADTHDSPDGAAKPGSSGTFEGRDTPRKRLLRAVAAQGAVLSAAVHLLWAWPHLSTVDPRPYVFVLAAVFTTLVAAATLQADEYRRLYALGAGTLAAFPIGYLGWYGAGTTAALSADPLAIVGKVAEVAGALAFVGLYRLAPPTSVVLERRRAQGKGAPLSVLDPNRLADRTEGSVADEADPEADSEGGNAGEAEVTQPEVDRPDGDASR